MELKNKIIFYIFLIIAQWNSGVFGIYDDDDYYSYSNTNLLKPKEDNSSVLESSCIAFRNALSQSITDTVNCFSLNSRPFNLCRACNNIYCELNHLYLTMKLQILSPNVVDRNCIERVISSDNVVPLLQFMNAINKTWTDASCNNCFIGGDQSDNNDPNYDPTCQSSHYTNNTRTFLQYHRDLLTCLAPFSNVSHIMFGFNRLDTPWNPEFYDTNACKACNQYYYKLNNFYGGLEEKYGYNYICMDVEDSMNYTRRAWWYLYECQVHPMYEYLPLLPLVVSILALSLFYIVLACPCCCQSPKKTLHIYRERRVRLRTASNLTTTYPSDNRSEYSIHDVLLNSSASSLTATTSGSVNQYVSASPRTFRSYFTSIRKNNKKN